MTFAQLPPHIQAAATRVLTDKQLEAWTLELAGWSQQRIAYRLGVSRGAIRDRLTAVGHNLEAAGIVQDEHGAWTLTSTEAA